MSAAVALRVEGADGRGAEGTSRPDVTREVVIARLIQPGGLETPGFVTDGFAWTVGRIDTTDGKEATSDALVVGGIGGGDREFETTGAEALPDIGDTDRWREFLGVGLFTQEGDGSLAFDDEEEDLFESDIIGDAGGELDVLFKDLAFGGRTDEDLRREGVDAYPHLDGGIREVTSLINGTSGEDDLAGFFVGFGEADRDRIIGSCGGDPRLAEGRASLFEIGDVIGTRAIIDPE